MLAPALASGGALGVRVRVLFELGRVDWESWVRGLNATRGWLSPIGVLLWFTLKSLICSLEAGLFFICRSTEPGFTLYAGLIPRLLLA